MGVLVLYSGQEFFSKRISVIEFDLSLFFLVGGRGGGGYIWRSL